MKFELIKEYNIYMQMCEYSVKFNANKGTYHIPLRLSAEPTDAEAKYAFKEFVVNYTRTGKVIDSVEAE